MSRARRKRGFTLVETVVTVGIIGALAAVVYPTVVKQFDSADPARAAEDLANIRTGIEAFGINVRPQFPTDIEDLVNQPAVTGDSTFPGALFTESDRINWHGPYIALSVPTTALQDDTAAVTGFGARVMNRLHPYDVSATTLGSGGDTVALSSSAADFVAVRIVGLSAAAFDAINLAIDGPTEPNLTRRRDSGRFRCPFNALPAATAPCPNAYYLAVPTR